MLYVDKSGSRRIGFREVIGLGKVSVVTNRSQKHNGSVWLGTEAFRAEV